MIVCGARHPERIDVLCVEWSDHRSHQHQGYPPGALQIKENEVRWDVVPAAEKDGCISCGAKDGHMMRCPVVFDAYYAYRGAMPT